MNYSNLFTEEELKAICYTDTRKLQFTKENYGDTNYISEIASKEAENYLQTITYNPVQFVEIGLLEDDAKTYRYTLVFYRIDEKKIDDYIDKIGIDGIKDMVRKSKES